MSSSIKERVLRDLRVSSPNAEVITLSALAEGMNMGIWIGFKHVNYLIEHAVSLFLRSAKTDVRSLWWGEGWSFHIVDSKVRYQAALTFDEPVHVCMVPESHGAGVLSFDIHAASERMGSMARIARSSLRCVVADSEGRPVTQLPEGLAKAVGPPALSGSIRAGSPPTRAGNGSGEMPADAVQQGGSGPAQLDAETGRDPRPELGIDDPGTFVWSRRMAYFYCGYFRWAHHSAYLRLMEEGVDRFLDHIGLNIGDVFRERRWIPVVQEHRIAIHERVEMEERVFTTLRVTNIIADRLHRAEVRWLVLRNGTSVEVATGSIVHGYVEVGDPEWESRLVRLDDETVKRLTKWAQMPPEVSFPGKPGSGRASLQ